MNNNTNISSSSPFPPPPASPATPTSPASFLRRRAQAPPVIFTDVPAGHLLPYTPATAAPPQSAAGVFRISPSGAAMTSYNPQEWGRAGQGQPAGAYLPHNAAVQQARTRGTRDMTGMEAQLPEPPPPYTASTSTSPTPGNTRSSPHIASSTFSPVQGTSPSTLAHDPTSHQSPIPQTPSHPSTRLSTFLPPSVNYSQQAPPSSFPPPPPSGARDRSGSRPRGVFSSITAIASRHRQAETSPAPTTRLDSHPREAGSRANTSGPVVNTPPSHRSVASYAVASPNVEQPIPPPPTARRSVSVGLVGSGADSSSRAPSTDRSTSSVWQPGMPLPPPPPGGPPGSRSQSADRSSARSGETITQTVHAPAQRSLGTVLSPVPATPAGWREDDARPPRSLTEAEHEAQRLGLRLETHPSQPPEPLESGEITIMSAVEFGDRQANGSRPRDGFGRMAAQREPSSKGIRERRIESRSRIREPQTAVEPHNASPWSDESKPPNLVLASTNSGMISRRRHVQKSAASPRALGHPLTPSSPYDAPDTGRSAASDMGLRSAPMDRILSTSASNPTPPFSPDSDARDRKVQSARAQLASSNTALPTPLSAPLNSAKSTASERHFYTPLDKSSTVNASPVVVSSPPDGRNSRASTSAMDPFSEASLDRYRTFLERETFASNDLERLELFAAFFVSESRLRRDKYAQAFENLGSDVLDLTRDLWRSNSSSKRGKQPATRLDTGMSSRAGSVTPLPDPSSASSAGGAAFTPRSDDESPSSTTSTGSMARNQKQQQAYQPCLSPILSMAQSTVPDEEDSRGRAPSRWWETSDEHRSFTNGARKVERSKRESKYMGLPLGNLEDMQWDDQGEAGPSNYYSLGPNEYPAEKTGWGDDVTPSRPGGFVPLSRTPQPPKMDVSRLITLPPPYPRHHPAVNNNHPELASLRATLRTLNETPEKEEFQARYDAEHVEADFDPRASEQRRRDLRRQIQARVSEGTMSFAEAAQAESGFDGAELKHFKDQAKANFHDFQRDVLQPLSAILNEKVNTATQSIDVLRTSLIDSATTHNPNTTQESGDELPELLEKITLMKWLFEAREQLHKDLFDVQSASDALYGQVILAPYRAHANASKIAEVTSFFASDRRERDLTSAQEQQARFESFHAVVADSVTRGVEAQLSAFWDIAPPLLEVVDRVPTDTSRFAALDIAIPPAELAENPAYAAHPLQYLYTLVAHAERAAYQLIESQTNLLCLLHEIKTGVMGAGVRVLQATRLRAEPARSADIEAEMAGIRADEDGRLTRDLKERVQLVEEQWQGALGAAMRDCTARVKGWLESVGGWDEALEE